MLSSAHDNIPDFLDLSEHPFSQLLQSLVHDTFPVQSIMGVHEKYLPPNSTLFT